MYTCVNLVGRVLPSQTEHGTGSGLCLCDGRPFISRLAEENNPSVPVADVYCDEDDCDDGDDEDDE